MEILELKGRSKNISADDRNDPNRFSTIARINLATKTTFSLSDGPFLP